MSRLALALLSAALLRAETGAPVTGSVLDSQDAAISSAEITLLARAGGVRLTVRADAAGNFRFERVAPGAYLLEASAPGFTGSAPRNLDVSAHDNPPVRIHLEVAGIRTTIVVTASGTPQTTDESSKAITVVDSQTIELRDEFAVPQALEGVPGVRINRLGGPGAFTSIRIRGLRDQDTALLVDGFRIRDAGATQGDVTGFFSDLAATDLDRIEVLRGAGSSIYGSNAIGGVINLITDEGGGRTHGSLLTEGGSLGMFRGRAKMAGGWLHDRLQYSAGVSHWNVLEGLDGDDPARNTSAQARLGYVLSSNTRLSARFFSGDAFSKLNSDPAVAPGVPAHGILSGPSTFVPDTDDPDSTRASRLFSGAATLTSQPTARFGYTLGYQALHTYRGFGNGSAGAGYQPTASNIWNYDGSVHTLEARFNLQLGTRQRLNGGYEFERESYHSFSLPENLSELSRVDVAQRSHSLFAQDQISLLGGRLQLAASGRMQLFTLGTPFFDPSASAPYQGSDFHSPPRAYTGDGSAAYFFSSTGTKLRAHAGRGYRAPSLYERFGSYFSSFGYSNYGDPRLAPDRSTAFDTGIDQILAAGRVRLSATYFYTWLQEVIVFDSTPAPDPYGRWSGYFNTPGGIARGFEASAALQPTPTLDLNASYTFTNARERHARFENVLRSNVIPVHEFSFFAVQRLGRRLTLQGGFVSFSNYLAPLFDPVTYASREFLFPGKKQVQCGAGYRVPLSDTRAVRFFANADNLLDENYFEGGFRTPGRTARGGLQFEF